MIFKKLFDWYNKRKINNLEKKQNKDKTKLYQYLRQGYNFLKWCDKQFPNRHSRKQFYNDIFHNGVINSRFVEMFIKIIDKYEETQKKPKLEKKVNG